MRGVSGPPAPPQQLAFPCGSKLGILLSGLSSCCWTAPGRAKGGTLILLGNPLHKQRLRHCRLFSYFTSLRRCAGCNSMKVVLRPCLEGVACWVWWALPDWQWKGEVKVTQSSGIPSSGHPDSVQTGQAGEHGGVFSLQNQSCESLVRWGIAALPATHAFFIKAKVIRKISSLKWLFVVGWFFINWGFLKKSSVRKPLRRLSFKCHFRWRSDG